MNSVYTLCEWEVALGAWSYEMTGRATMTDATYDRMCQSIGARGSSLPGFSDMTGQWVHNMDMDILKNVCEYAWSINDGKDDLHAPAIKAALDHYGQKYRCCMAGGPDGFNCYD